MLRNFVTDSDLEGYFPNIVNFRQGGQQDYSTAINKAFEFVIDDLENRGFKTRLMMVPIDLARDSDATANIQKLTSVTISATTSYDAWKGGRQRRFVVNLTDKSDLTDDWSFILQGSNELSTPEDDSDDWEDVETIQYDAGNTAEQVIENSEVFSTMYAYYRLKVVKNGGSGSVTFTASVYEKVFDFLIACKTLEFIAMGWKSGLNVRWDDMQEDMAVRFETALASIKCSYDADQDGIPEESEEKVSVGGRIGSMGLSA